MSIVKVSEKKDLEADIVVIGGGGAGMAAAVSSLENGITDVIVLEKRFKIGGNASMAGGFLFAAESHRQKEAGINISRDDIFKEAMAFHHYDRVDPRILRAFLNKSADTIQWLEKRGIEFEYKMGTHILKDITQPIGGFDRVIKIIGKEFKEKGGQILLNTGCKCILREGDNEITAVEAIDKEGDKLRIKTRSVILTTGGFTGNRKLLKKYFPYYYDDIYWTDAIPLKGDGINLATQAGAYIEDFLTLIREPCYSFTPGKNRPHRVSTEPSSVWVNGKGERFIDESTGHQNASTNALLRQPGKIAYALFDEIIVENMTAKPDLSNGEIPMGGPGEKIPFLKEQLMKESINGEWVAISDRWKDIASWMGADPGILKETLTEYNSCCDNGYDVNFIKDKRYLIPIRHPPFYAVKFRPLMIDTVGPVRVNANMEVLDKELTPIPGFFAGGVITGGWQSHDYHLFGSALSYSLNSGRIAAENAAQFIINEVKQ